MDVSFSSEGHPEDSEDVMIIGISDDPIEGMALRIFAAHGEDVARAEIGEDGAVRLGVDGHLLGFVNADGSAGNASEEFMGEINQGGQVINANDETIGYIDMGKATLRDANDSHFATLVGTGEVRDTMETLVARIEGFSFQRIRQVAAYVFFFDQALIKPNLPSLVESVRAERHPAAHAPAPAAAPAPAPRGVVDDSHLDGTGLGEDSVSKEEERLMKHLKLGGASASKLAPKSTSTPATAASAPAATAAAATKTVTTPSTWKPTEHEGPAPTDDRGLQTDAARREEERIAKMFGGMSGASKSTSPSSTAASSGSAASTVAAASSATPSHPVPVQPSTGSNFELELWREINTARSQPQQYAQHLREMLPHFDGTRYNIPGTKTARETREGASAVEKAISFLESHRVLSELSLSPGLSHSCRDLVGKASQATNIGGVETDAESDQRLSKYGSFVGRLFQNVALGNLSPRDIVISWIVDDGNASKQHRECLFDAANSVVGISSGPHMKFARVTVVAAAGSYREASAAAAQEGTVAAVQVVPPDAPEVEKETEINVGAFEERKDAFFIDITNLGCPAKALKLRLEKQGIELVVRRKVTVAGQIREFAQRLALPFPFQPSQISASYAVGIGKLALELKKVSGSTAPAASGATSGEVGRFRVSADSSKANDKIAVQPAQTSDHFAFSCDNSKYDTDVVVSLDGRKLSFAAQYSFDTVVDGEDVVKTVKANSAFTLPFDATMSQIELVPNGSKGSIVKVYKVAPAGASSGGVSILDTDINILTKS